MKIPVQYIDLTNHAVEYTDPWMVTETSHKDIHADQLKVCLGSYTTPGDWQIDPTVVELTHPQIYQIQYRLLVGGDYNPGVQTDPYWLWRWLIDSPESLPKRLCQQVVLQ